MLLFAGRFKPSIRTRKLSFPRDHGAHEDARVEWWYVQGSSKRRPGGGSATSSRSSGPGSRTTPRRARRPSRRATSTSRISRERTRWRKAGRFRFAERLHRDGPGAAYARTGRLCVVNEDWRLEELGGRLVLFAKDSGEELSLVLSPEKPPVLHGPNAISRKGPEPEAVSKYVSLTRLASAGWWTSGGASEAVTGLSWFDHEWGSGSIGKETQGWDWFAVHLLDGRDLMLYRLRGASGPARRFPPGRSSRRTARVDLARSTDFSIEETARWKSPKSGATYPARWVLRVAEAGLVLDILPLVPDQELVTEKSTRVTYWEGACDVKTPAGAPAGRAYVEMTGYAGAGGLGLFR